MKPSRTLWALGAVLVVVGLVNVFLLAGGHRAHGGRGRPLAVVPVPTPESTGRTPFFHRVVQVNLSRPFYEPVHGYEPRSGDLVVVKASGEATWVETSSALTGDDPRQGESAYRVTYHIDPDGTHKVPREKPSFGRPTQFPAYEAPVASLIGVLGSRTRDAQSGVETVAGSAHFWIGRERAFLVPAGVQMGWRFFLAANMRWKYWSWKYASGTWTVDVTVYRHAGTGE